MKQRIKKALGLGCSVVRIGRALARAAPGRFVILMFHRVVGAEEMQASANQSLMMHDMVFSRLALTLSENCLCLRLEEALARADAREPAARPVVVLTFDDGYADCHRTVYPILKRHGLPATIYLTTGPLDRPGHRFWWDAVEAYFTHPMRPQAFSEAGLPEFFTNELEALSQSPSVQGVEAFIRGPLYRLDKAQRDSFVRSIGSGAAAPPDMLTWGQVREMADSGLVEFGAHTVTHPFLDELALAEAATEVLASKERIEEQTGRAVTSFAYPSGRVPAFHREMLGRAGLDLAVTTRSGINAKGVDPLLLRRMDARLGLAGQDFSPAYFLALCSGCLAWLN